MLAPDESERALRFRQIRDRRRFVERRAILRMIVSRYVAASPGEIRFSYGPNGKPRLTSRGDDASLRFSLTSRDDVALYAVTRHREVGVDVEAVKPLPEMDGLIARFFTTRDADSMAELGETERRHAFFSAWTRKEAYLKALGDGLSRPPDQVDVGRAADRGSWRIETIVPLAGYLGAIAAEGDDWRVTCLRWPPASPVPD